MNNKKIKLVLYPVLYWVIFIIIPYFIAYITNKQNISFDLPAYIVLYILFIAPFLYIIPYKLVKLRNKKAKIFLFF